ncbi:hypothetical protein KGF54_001061 [Candida jiufengensis]|uniref:uncharacterized protein n=1 Tax=Candida jiufengensis TaxID=497108 RepID=UPI0022255DB2|nr:uncharacterized protein KGF54_001061 [Candida jiufengensis]KAI5956586.1 hypothetical protein KGF54_001061 [Candida jiufengensis]
MSIDHIIKAKDILYKDIIKELSDQSSKKFDNNTKTLEQLDYWKDNELQDIVKTRYNPKDQTTYLTKNEVVNLMDWKLSKGKFRPQLPKLIRSNSEKDVEQFTKDGFRIFLQYSQSLPKDFTWIKASIEDREEYSKVLKSSMKELCKLKGVGPATASLLLTCLFKINEKITPPFFSDEAFMYYVIDPSRPNTSIKYNVKEYLEEYIPILLKILREAETPVKFIDLEKGGWALKYYSLHDDDILISITNPFGEDEKDWDKLKVKFEDEEKEITKDTKPLKKKRKTK